MTEVVRCTHDRGHDSSKKTDLALAKTDILLANGDEPNLILPKLVSLRSWRDS